MTVTNEPRHRVFTFNQALSQACFHLWRHRPNTQMRTSDPGEGGTPRPPAGGTAVPLPRVLASKPSSYPTAGTDTSVMVTMMKKEAMSILTPHVCAQGPHCLGGITQPLPEPCPCYLPLGEVGRTQARSPWGLTTRLTPTHPVQKVPLDTQPWGRQRTSRNARETAEAQTDVDSSEGQRARGSPAPCQLPSV